MERPVSGTLQLPNTQKNVALLIPSGNHNWKSIRNLGFNSKITEKNHVFSIAMFGLPKGNIY